MRFRFRVTGPHTGTTYPEWEVEQKSKITAGWHTVAYLHSQNYANLLVAVLNKGK